MYRLSINCEGDDLIQIDDFEERFESDLTFWSPSDYRVHWSDASQLVREGVPAIFLTSITHPEVSNFFRSWCCYPMKNELVFQERVLFLDNLNIPFDLSKPEQSIGPYESVGEDGVKISEWRTIA